MTQKTEKTCPTCQGKKVVAGTCECNMEWRGTQGENGWDDCQSSPEQECPTCGGTGVVESDE